MAIAAGTVWEIRSGATASNVNGGGFNPANAGMLTDLTTNANTANTASPVVSSVSYAFLAGDVNDWLYIKSGTNWTPGWYQIASVAGGKATLSAAIGAAIVVNANNMYVTNTVAGCATVGTPTAGTFTIDYSQNNTTDLTLTDLVSVGSSTTMTSITAVFTPVMVGNIIHITTTGTGAFGVVGWYEIVTYNSTSSVVTDRTTNNGTAMAAVTGNIGGALSLGSSDDAVFELATASATLANRFFVQGGSAITYTLGGTVSISASGNSQQPIVVEGYGTLRGDRPTGATRPTFACGANSFTFGSSWSCYNVNFTGTGTTLVVGGTFGTIVGCKIINSSTTTTRIGVSISSSGLLTNCEAISYRGRAVTPSSSGCVVDGCYIHDSDTGISAVATIVSNCIIADCVTAAAQGTITTSSRFFNNTVYGAENKLGIGFNLLTGSQNVHIVNNIFYGLVTGVSDADVQTAGYDDYNNYFNNTNDVNATANWQKGAHDIAVNPSFTNAAQLTGSTATTSGSVLTQSGGDFTTVTNNVDFVYIKSGTGITVGKYLITGHTTTTITLDSAPGTSATADKVWQITTGHDFSVGTAMKATGYPGVFPGGLTTGYIDAGAVQRQEPSAAGTSMARVFTGM